MSKRSSKLGLTLFPRHSYNFEHLGSLFHDFTLSLTALLEMDLKN